MRSRTGSRVSTTPTRPEPAAVRQPIRAVNSQEPLPAHPSRDWLLRGPPARIKPTPKRPSTGEEPPQGSRLSGSRAANEASNCAVRDPRVVAAPGQQARRRRPHRCSRERSGPSDRTRGRSAARAGVLGGVAACRLRSAQVAATSCNYQPTPDRGSIGHPLGRAARDATARAASSRRGSPRHPDQQPGRRPQRLRAVRRCLHRRPRPPLAMRFDSTDGITTHPRRRR